MPETGSGKMTHEIEQVPGRTACKACRVRRDTPRKQPNGAWKYSWVVQCWHYSVLRVVMCEKAVQGRPCRRCQAPTTPMTTFICSSIPSHHLTTPLRVTHLRILAESHGLPCFEHVVQLPHLLTLLGSSSLQRTSQHACTTHAKCQQVTDPSVLQHADCCEAT